MTETSLRHMLRQSLTTFETRIDPADTVVSVEYNTPLASGAEGMAPFFRRTCLHLLKSLDLAPSEDLVLSSDAVQHESEKLLRMALVLDSLYADGSLKPQQSSTVREAAICAYRLSIALAPTPKAYNNIAVLAADAGDENVALEWLERGLEQFPSDKTLRGNFDLLNEE